MNPDAIDYITWFFQGAISILVPVTIAFITLHIYYTNK